MDAIVTKKYRHFLENGFENTGTIENPSIFLDTKLEGLSICGQVGRDYMNVYIKIEHDRITDIKYLCICDPMANVVVETLCQLARGKTIDEAKKLDKRDFFNAIGSESELLEKKVLGIIELLNRGMSRFEKGENS